MPVVPSVVGSTLIDAVNIIGSVGLAVGSVSSGPSRSGGSARYSMSGLQYAHSSRTGGWTAGRPDVDAAIWGRSTNRPTS